MGSRTCVRTTDVSPSVKNNADRMNQLVRQTFLLGQRSVCRGIPDTCRDHRHLTTCQKQHRQNKPAGQVGVPTRVEVCVTGDPRHMYGVEICVMGNPDMCRDHRRLTVCQKQYRQNESAGQVDVPTRVEGRVTGDPRYMYGPQTSHRLSKTTHTE